MLEGVEAYQDSDIEVEETPHDVIWQKGAARLLDYSGDADAPAVLCIPSLINKYYILDLYPERSLIAYLLVHGFRPLVLDWGEPSAREKTYDCGDYVQYLAADAFNTLKREHRAPIHLLGYCMGGVLALGLAQMVDVASLSLLATPWDYHAVETLARQTEPDAIAKLDALLRDQDTVPAAWTQSLFHLLNPWHFQEKFERFKSMSDEQQYHFVAVEAWVNDGIPLARKVARECFISWPVNNALAMGRWKIKSAIIDPATLTCPVFIAAPADDKIVPLPCAMALANLIPHAHTITPSCGHVSMVVGTHAKKQLWQPLVKWLKAQ